jgi:hypothetical protein
MYRRALAIPMLILVSVAVSAETLAPMPRPLSQRWLTSVSATEGWNAPGYDARG